MPEQIIPSKTGNISLNKMTNEAMELILNASEKAILAQLPNVSKAAGGEVREFVTDSYFMRNGFTKFDGKCGGNNCFDGVYVKGDTVYIVDAKPLSGAGSTSLNPGNASTGLPPQLTDAWVNCATAELKKSADPAVRKTADLIVNASKNGNLVKLVAAADGKGLKVIRVK